MSASPTALQQATSLQHCKTLHLPTVGGQSGPSASQLRDLAESGYIARTEPVVFIGDCGNDVIALDEVGYVPLAEVGAELVSDHRRPDRTAALILTTNLPFSEWTQVIPNARLCKAVLDRITDRAHIIDTGQESYLFRRTLEKRQKKR